MKFTCEKDALAKELAVAQEIISSKNALSILSNVLLDVENNTLHIRATDLKVSFQTKIPVEVSSPGSITVFCDKFLGYLRALPSGDVEFEEADKDNFVIKPLFKKSENRLKTISSEKFPELPSPGEEKFFEFSQKDIIEMISHTIFSVSDDETRYFMNGVYLEKSESENSLIMVATDGRRLSYSSKQPENTIGDFKPVIIPPKALNLVKKLASGEGNMSLAISEKNVFFYFDNQKISSSLIEGNFPNYQKVIPEKQVYTIRINREEFIDALKRVSLMVEQRSRRVHVYLKKACVVLSSEESEIGVAKEEIGCDYDGEEVAFAFNYMYFTEPLREMTDEDILFEYTEKGKAVTLRSAEKRDYFHIIMPMMLD
jgi:DNA polymerase-3 subunit beta